MNQDKLSAKEDSRATLYWRVESFGGEGSVRIREALPFKDGRDEELGGLRRQQAQSCFLAQHWCAWGSEES